MALLSQVSTQPSRNPDHHPLQTDPFGYASGYTTSIGDVQCAPYAFSSVHGTLHFICIFKETQFWVALACSGTERVELDSLSMQVLPAFMYPIT